MGIRQNSTLLLFFNMEESTAWSYINRNDISNIEMIDVAREKKRIIIRAQTLERKKEIWSGTYEEGSILQYSRENAPVSINGQAE